MTRWMRFHEATCLHAERAQRGRFREIVNHLEEESPGTPHAIVRGYDQLRPLFAEHFPPAPLQECVVCGEPTSGITCKACELQARLRTIDSLEVRPPSR